MGLVVLHLASPINQMYSFTTHKDLLFSIVCTWFLLSLLVITDKSNNRKKVNKLCWLLYVSSGFLTCIMRSNSRYAFYALILFMFCFRSMEKWKLIGASALIIVLIQIYHGPVFNYFNVSEPDAVESLALPLMQICGTLHFDGEITEEQMELIDQVADHQGLSDAYARSPQCVDDIKEVIREHGNQEIIKEHAIQYAKLYWNLMQTNFGVYSRAFVDETDGYWYCRGNAIHLWHTYIDDSTDFGFYRSSKVPEQFETGYKKYLERFSEWFHHHWSIALVIIPMFISFLCIFIHRRHEWIAYLYLALLWCTVIIATPVNGDIRYVYALVFSLPLTVGIPLTPIHVQSLSEQSDKFTNTSNG